MTAGRFFITGTDTGMGKTLVVAALLLNARGHGRSAIGLKPVSAGCVRQGADWVNEDARLLRQHASRALPYAQVNPVALEPAIAPHLAATRAGMVLDARKIAAQVRGAGGSGEDIVLVEGCGGWAVPLNERETMADVAVALGYPVLLVVGLRLGCLNHALLTADAIRRAELPLAGWVANCIDPQMVAAEENLQTLEQRLGALRLGTIPFLGATATPEQANLWLDGTALFVP